MDTPEKIGGLVESTNSRNAGGKDAPAGNGQQKKAAKAASPTPVDEGNLEKALASLNTWAEASRVADDPAVIRLKNGIESRQNLSMWATKDIETFLPQPVARARIGPASLVTLLIFLRNILVFVPILITWRAISVASSAFAVFAQSIPEGEDVNFLRYWQTGGEGLLPGVSLPPAAIVPPIDRLSQVAILDAAIIFVVIVFTIVAGVLQILDRRLQSTVQDKADKQRIEVVLELESALHGYRQATPTSISETLAESLGALLQAAHQLGATARQLETSTAGVAELGPAIKGFTTQMAEAERTFASGVTPSLGQLASTLDGLTSRVGTDYIKVVRESLEGLEELRASVERTVAIMEIGTQAMKTDIDAIVMALGASRMR